MTIKRYGVYLARFIFLESTAYKIRPVIAICPPTGIHNVVILIPISARPELEEVDVKLQQWRASGLTQPSIARLHRLTALSASNVLEEVGHIGNADRTTIQKALRKLLDL